MLNFYINLKNQNTFFQSKRNINQHSFDFRYKVQSTNQNVSFASNLALKKLRVMLIAIPALLCSCGESAHKIPISEFVQKFGETFTTQLLGKVAEQGLNEVELEGMEAPRNFFLKIPDKITPNTVDDLVVQADKTCATDYSKKIVSEDPYELSYRMFSGVDIRKQLTSPNYINYTKTASRLDEPMIQTNIFGDEEYGIQVSCYGKI